MKRQSAFHQLSPLMATQWGLVTTAQAQHVGVSRSTLNKLETEGKLERLLKGVYRNTSAPSERFESIHAAWLSIYPQRTAEERLQDPIPDAVASSHTAAWLLGIGDIVPEPYCFSTPVRKQTQRTGITLRTRKYHPESLTNREGLPVTTIEQTIADLIEDGTDLSLVSDIFLNADAEMITNLNRPYLAELLAPYAKRNGFPNKDGEKLLQELLLPLNDRIRHSLEPLLLKAFAESLAPALENMQSTMHTTRLPTSLLEEIQKAAEAFIDNANAIQQNNNLQQLAHALQRYNHSIAPPPSIQPESRSATNHNHVGENT